MKKNNMQDRSSPGIKLRNLLNELIPLDNDSESFIFQIDWIMKSDNELKKFFYDSSINYLVRRLITTATYLKKQYSNDFYPSGKYIEELRNFLKHETRFDRTSIEEILTYLIQCLDATEAKIPSGVRNTLNKQQKRCYICGNDLIPNNDTLKNVDFADIRGGKLDIIQNDQYFSINVQHLQFLELINPDDSTKLKFQFPLNGKFSATNAYSPYSPEVEHIWPRAMGGLSDDNNLLMACAECNKIKEDFIDASDYHYEEICLASCDETTDEFEQELKRNYKLALWSKVEYQCEQCGAKAKDLGRLEFIRKNKNDSWHFLNISVLCPSCAHRYSRVP